MLQRKKEEEAARGPKPERVKRTKDNEVTVARKKTGKQRKAIQTKEDVEELEHEYRLLKRLKRGAIDESEYERLTGFASEEEDSQENENDKTKHKGQRQKSNRKGGRKGHGGKVDKGYRSKSGFKSKTTRRK